MTDSTKCSAPFGTLSAASAAAYDQTLLGRFDRRHLQNPRVWRALLAIWIVLLVIPAVQFVIDINNVEASIFRGPEKHKTALGRWLPTADLLWQGPQADDPYGFGHWFPTPPLMLISIAPLSRIGYVPAGIVWATLKIIGLLAALGLLLRELARRGCAVPAGVLLITALFSFRPVIGDIQHGNLNLFMLLWIAFAWAFYLRGRDLLCGLFVALAVATKITPALLIIYFLYKKNWRVCIGATIGLALFFFVIPGLTLGFERNWQLLQSWYHMLVEPFARHGYVTREITNQSLHGVAVRLLSNAGWLSIEHMPPEMETVTGADKSVRPATQVGMLLKPALSLSVLAALAWICRPLRGKASLTDAPRLAERGAPRFGVELAAILLAMLLLSERTWKHHATTLPLVYLALWYAVACVPWTPRFRGLCVGLLGVQLAFLTLSTEGVVGEKIADHLQDGGFYCWGLVLALVQAGLMAGALRANRNQLDITSN